VEYARPAPTRDVAVQPAGMPAVGVQPPALPRTALSEAFWLKLADAWWRCGYALAQGGGLEYRA
jgi:hypothetical protein